MTYPIEITYMIFEDENARTVIRHPLFDSLDERRFRALGWTIPRLGRMRAPEPSVSRAIVD